MKGGGGNWGTVDRSVQTLYFVKKLCCIVLKNQLEISAATHWENQETSNMRRG